MKIGAPLPPNLSSPRRGRLGARRHAAAMADA